jgi:PD-(D/E)XK endonuclease
MKPGTKKQKGDFAELKVACDLRSRGYLVCIPFGEEAPYDLVIDRAGCLERVQVKYRDRSGRPVIEVPCYSQTIIHGKVVSRTPYTAETIDWLALYDADTDRCFYIPAEELGNGRSHITLRFAPTRNGQRAGIRFADSYADLESRDLRLNAG